jgi:hypothetical protein
MWKNVSKLRLGKLIIHCWFDKMTLAPELILNHCHILSGFFLYFNLTWMIGPHMLENEWPIVIFHYVQHKPKFNGSSFPSIYAFNTWESKIINIT